MAFNFLSYIQDVAQKHKDIVHTSTNKRYYEISGIGGMEDVLLNLRSMDGTIIMAETNQEGRMINGGNENYVDIPRFRFYVMKRASFSDRSGDTAAKQACKLLAFSILGKMRHDKIASQRGEADATYKEIDLDAIRYDTVGPIATGWVGCMVELSSLSLASGNGFSYNESDYS